MKTIKLLLLLAITGLTLSCNNDDNSAVDNGFFNSWSLIKAGNGFGGINNEFEPGIIIWHFNQNGTVTVTNNNTDEQAYDYFDSGTYNYQFTTGDENNSGCEKELTVNNRTFGCFTMENNTLRLDESYIDGDYLIFERQ